MITVFSQTREAKTMAKKLWENYKKFIHLGFYAYSVDFYTLTDEERDAFCSQFEHCENVGPYEEDEKFEKILVATKIEPEGFDIICQEHPKYYGADTYNGGTQYWQSYPGYFGNFIEQFLKNIKEKK